jgi:Cu+-exporting ATPase
LSIEKKLNNRGLKNVRVSFPNAEAAFINDAKLPLQSIVTDIENLGYKVIFNKNDSRKVWYKTTAGRFYLTLPFSALLMLHMVFSNGFLGNHWVQLSLCLPVFIIGWISFGKSSITSTLNGTANMDVLVLLGSSAAFIYSVLGMFLMPESHQMLFFETTSTIITLVLLGNLIEQRTVQQTTSAIRDLVELQPQLARKVYLFLGEEKTEEINLKEIKPGDILLVNTGDKIPADGEIIWGSGTINESMITGETMPLEADLQGKVLAGTILAQGCFKMRVTKSNEDSALAQIIALVKEAQRNKPKIQKLGDSVSNIFVPSVILISIITFFVALSVAFGIASVLAISVTQRTREIGILRAMGIRRSQILQVFLLQGALLGLIGSAIGASFGYLLVMAFNQFGPKLFYIELPSYLIGGATAVATVVGILAALAPAWRASRLDPVQAIRYV